MFLDDMAVYVQEAGLGVVDTSLFLGSDVIVPSDASDDGPYTLLRNTGGVGPTRIQNTAGAATRRPSAQVVSVARTRNAAYDHIHLLFELLDGKDNLIINGVEYVWLRARQEPTDIGMDGQRRLQFAFNIEAEKKPS